MASTTKTVNLELSQFVGTDKPAWLTDYNGDMQKIDDGYKKLEDANTATQTDLDATKQDLAGSQTDINDVKASVQALEAQDIALGNRLTVVEGNYDTMHHEIAINKQSIKDIETDLGADEALETTATTVNGAINEVNKNIKTVCPTYLASDNSVSWAALDCIPKDNKLVEGTKRLQIQSSLDGMKLFRRLPNGDLESRAAGQYLIGVPSGSGLLDYIDTYNNISFDLYVGSTVADKPLSSNACMVHVIKSSSDTACIIALTPLSSGIKMHTRCKATGIWTDWKEVTLV